MINYKHLFGPVPSRRLGRSLGIDLVPLKTCTLNCLFCQAGCTTLLTDERKEYVPFSEVKAEFDAWLEFGGTADFVTLSGSGEPTLNSAFGEVLKYVGTTTSIKKALLSNGTLFFMPEVRAAAMHADLVKVTVSAWDQDSFRGMTRGHSSLRHESIIDGIKKFRSGFDGVLWVEVFVLKGFNDSQEAMTSVASIVSSFRADAVHLNTVVRVPAEQTAQPVSREELERFARVFEPVGEVIPDQDPNLNVGEQVGKRPLTPDSFIIQPPPVGEE